MRWLERMASLSSASGRNIYDRGEIKTLAGVGKEVLMRKFIAASLFAMLAAYLFGAPLHAEEVRVGDLVISQAWSRATPNGAKIGAGYLTIENKGTTADKLIGATADISGHIEVHVMSMNNGVMKMRPVEGGLAINSGKTVKLSPNGYHLMIMDLKSPLKRGEKLPVTLEFEKAGKVAVTLDVQSVGAQGPGGGDGMKMAPNMKM